MDCLKHPCRIPDLPACHPHKTCTSAHHIPSLHPRSTKTPAVDSIESIDQPDASWDLIICSHVLQHVDRRKALKELFAFWRPAASF